MTETQLQIAVVSRYKKFWKPCYPNCKVIANPFSSFKMNARQMQIAKVLGFESGQSDLIFLQPVGNYIGLALELKVVSITNKDGTLKKSKHLQRQNEYLESLKQLGFYASFVVGFEESVVTLDKYFANRL